MSTVVAHDVVVLGTGAAGLVAALAANEQGASVGLYEKGDVVGGTTALSGGIVWIPNNPHAAAAGLSDSREEALAYLDSLSLGAIDPALAADICNQLAQSLINHNTENKSEKIKGALSDTYP